MIETIDRDDPSTWRPLFDQVVSDLEEGRLPAGVDQFSMHIVLSVYDEAPHGFCHTAACLFGSAAVLAGHRDEDAVFTLWGKWKPDEGSFMGEVFSLCQMTHLREGEVVEAYRELEENWGPE